MPALREFTSEASAFSRWLTTYTQRCYNQYEAAVMWDTNDGGWIVVAGAWVTRYQADGFTLVSLHTSIQDAANESTALQYLWREFECPPPPMRHATRQWVYCRKGLER